MHRTILNRELGSDRDLTKRAHPAKKHSSCVCRTRTQLYTQDVYVVEINDVYYLCNPAYAGVNVELHVTL
jgi:hypothetical protein